MNIQLDDKWSITSDTHAVMLNRRGVSKIIGKKSEAMHTTYHSTVKSALEHYLNESMKDSESIDDIFKRIGEVEDKIEKLDEKALRGTIADLQEV
jgi:hypothetical protein